MSNIVITDGSDFYEYIFGDIDQVIMYPFNGFSKGKNSGWIGYRIAHSRYTRGLLIAAWIRFLIHKNGLKKVTIF